jgi:uncharacterized membrane protein YkvA (DUF1232 family)
MLSKIKLENPKDYIMAIFGGICLLYLINPTAGFLEFIPDNIPIIGNLDEAAAATGLLGVLRYFGYDFTKFINTKK